jgi:hypothetical protein
MPKQPPDYGESEIKELCDDSVKLLTKAYIIQRNGYTGKEWNEPPPSETVEKGHCLWDFARRVIEIDRGV